MNVLTRKQFKQYWNDIKPGLGDSKSGLWAWERHIKIYPRWFVNVNAILTNDERKQEFTDWCDNNCKGKILCYSSSDREEWFGFTRKADILLWLLRWS